jgi:hypothetical protein
VAIIGLREFEAALTRVAGEADAATQRAVARMSSLTEAAAKGNFQGSHTRGEPHVGTSPPRPNVVTGNLRRSIKTDPIERRGLGDYSTRVAPRAIYARAVELGRRPGSNAYPYFVPAVDAVRPRFPEITVEEWRKFLR